MTREEIRDRILSALNESTTDPSFWTTGEIDNLISDGMEVLAEEANSIKRSALVPFREGTIYYYTQSIAQDMMVPYRVWNATLDRRLTPCVVQDLDQHHETWPTVQGDAWWWFAISWNLFGIWPAPAQAGGVLRVDYLGWPRALLDDGDEPEFPEADHSQLVLYGIYEGLLKQWDLDRAIKLFAQFAERLPSSRYRKAAELKSSDLQTSMVAIRDARGERIIPN